MTSKDTKPNISIIGAGNLGVGLAQLFLKNNYPVILGSRDPEAKLRILNDLLPSLNSELVVRMPEVAVQTADITLLTVPDDYIESVCASLAKEFKSGSVVAHCSGALDSQSLSSAKELGCNTCSLHPLNTFPSITSAIDTLSTIEHKTYIYCEGESKTLDSLLPHFEFIGFNAFIVKQQDKPLYHAACVFASNYLTTLMDISMQTAEAAKIDRQQFWKSLQPLINTTLNNISKEGTSNALSGPIARGDNKTVAKHLYLLGKHKHSSIYADLGKQTLELAIKRGELDQEAIEELLTLFNNQRNTFNHD